MSDDNTNYFPPIVIESIAPAIDQLREHLKVEPATGRHQRLDNVRRRLADHTASALLGMPVLRAISGLHRVVTHIDQRCTDDDYRLAPTALRTSVERRLHLARERECISARDMQSYAASVVYLGKTLHHWAAVIGDNRKEIEAGNCSKVAEELVKCLEHWGCPFTVVEDRGHLGSNAPLGINLTRETDEAEKTTTLEKAGYTYEALVDHQNQIVRGKHLLTEGACALSDEIMRFLPIENEVTSHFLTTVLMLAIHLVAHDECVFDNCTSDMGFGGELSTEAVKPASNLREHLEEMESQAKELHERFKTAMRENEDKHAFISMKQQQRFLNVIRVATTGMKEIHRRFAGKDVEDPSDATGRLHRYVVNLMSGLDGRADEAADVGMTRRTGSEEDKEVDLTRLSHALDTYSRALHTLHTDVEARLGSKDAHLALLNSVVEHTRRITAAVYTAGDDAIKKLNVRKD